MARATVLIGCWNNAPTLPAAIDSILDQTLEDFELIVVDDGSTDETPEIVAGYSDPRVRRLGLEHMGIAASLNRGIAEAGSELIAFQDADDRSLPERLAQQAQLMDRSPRVAVAGCWMDEEDEKGRPLTPRQPRRSGVVTDVLAKFNPIPGTSAMVRKSAVSEAGGFDPSFRFAADYALWAAISQRHEVYCLDRVLAIRRMSSGQAGSRHEREQIREAMRVQLALARWRRSPLALRHLARPAVSLVTPRGLKAALRRRRGMAP